MKTFLLFFLTLIFTSSLQAQQITGTVKDEQGKALSGATLILKRSSDSATIKLGATNASGQYDFAGIKGGRYFINSSFVGYMPVNTILPEFSGEGTLTAKDIVLLKTSGNLKEVVVSTRKPVVEVKADKTILNVEGSVNAVGQDALELLRKSPGVMVDKDENISLSGKSRAESFL